MSVQVRRVNNPEECPFRSEGYRNIFDITDEGYRCSISTKCCKEQLREGNCPLKCTDILVKGEHSGSRTPQLHGNLSRAQKILDNIEHLTELTLFLVIEYDSSDLRNGLPGYRACLDIGRLVEPSHDEVELCGYGYTPSDAVINYVQNLLGKQILYLTEDDDTIGQFYLDMDGIVSKWEEVQE